MGIVYALFGGEYTVLDWIEMRQRVAAEEAEISQLEIETDSLRHLAEALEQDPATQEREARERFGMLRPGEVIFRVTPEPGPDSVRAER